MKLPLFLRSLALLFLLPLASPAHGQYSGSGSTMTMYYANGPATTMHASSGSTGFEVPVERTGHSFTFNWKTTSNGAVNSTTAYPMGFVTSSPVTGTNADVLNAAIRSLLVTAYTPSSYTYTPVTYTSGGSSYTSSTYTSVPFSCVEWWLVDTTANQYSTHANGTPAQNTPGQNVNLRSTIWTQIDAGTNRYFTIPDSRLGHALVAGSVAGGWSPVTQGYYTFGTYSGGTTGPQVPLHWFVGSAPVVPGDFSIADRTDGTKAPFNQTNVSNLLWNHDYTVYPLASVTFYLPVAEVNNLYVLHYQIPGQVPAAMTLWPTAVGVAFSTTTVNAGQKTIPAGAASVTGVIAVGANFWLTRNIDGYTTTPAFTLTSALANSTTPKVWSLALPPAVVNRVPMTFGIASTRAAQSFTVSQPSSFSATSPGSAEARPILSYEDYAPDHTPNSLSYFTVTAQVNPAEPFNLVAQTAGGSEMFSQGQVWVLDGWTALGGAAGPLPAGTPGQFAFSLKVAGPEPEAGLTLTTPAGASYPLAPTAPAIRSFADVWHPGTVWTAVEKTWSLTLPYTGTLGDWSLTTAADQAWSVSLNVGNTTNYLRNLGYQARVRPLVLDISLSRWAFDTAPRLRLRQRDGSDFPVNARSTTEWTSLASNATAWNSSAYLFQADTYARDGVDYWLYDEETGEESPYNTTNLTNWFALPTPAGLAGAVNAPTGAITLQWPLGFAASEGGFIVERQLSGETVWQTIGALIADSADGNGVLHFTDPNPVLGKVHTYQVRYTYGAGATPPSSAHSNRVVLTGWQDSDADGIPNWWETLYGLLSNDPHDADATAQSGDMSNRDKFNKRLVPTKTDFDGDGVVDTADAYPHDKKRSEDLPIIRYIAIDISTPVIGATSVSDIALDETGQAAFSYQYDFDAEDTIYYTRTWKNGVIGVENAFSRLVGEPGGAGWYRGMIGFVGPDGSLAGQGLELQPDPDNPGYVLSYGVKGIISRPGQQPIAPFQNTGDQSQFGIYGYPQGKLIWGQYWDPSTTSLDRAHAPFRIGDHLFSSSTINGRFEPDYYTVAACGKAAGWKDGDAVFWNLSTVSKLGDLIGTGATAHAISSDGVLFGTCAHLPNAVQIPEEAAGTYHPYLYDGTVTDLFSLFPEKFRRQIQFFDYMSAGLLNSRKDGMEWLALWKGPEESAHWEMAIIVWNASAQTVSEAILPDGIQFGGEQVMNKDGLIVSRQWKYPLDNDGNEDRNQPRYRAAVLLLPVDIAPDVLRVNTDFDEQKTDTATHYAKPDAKDETLKAEKGPNQGKIVTKDLHKGFFGVRPGTLNADFYTGATVTISKKEVIDPDTERPQPGTVRLHAVQKQGQADEAEWMIPTKEEDEDEATNLVPVLYASGATIPNGSDVEYWMEGVTPGKITLVFHYTKGATDFKHEQEFLVCTQQNKEDWQREIGKQILLETNGAVNMGGLVPTNEFTANIPYLKAVYGYYEQLFVLYPDQFIWAGMAKMAGAPVYAGLSDAQVLRTAGGILGPLLQLLTNLGVTAQIQEFQTQLMAGNKLIFDDLAWQHRAYVASGIWALEYVDEKDKTSSSRLRKVGIRDWQQIDEAIQKGESLSASLLDGNKKLLKREQEFIIQDVYDHIKAIQVSVSVIVGGYQFPIPLPVDYTVILSKLAKNPIPGGKDFRDFDQTGNIGNYFNRWNWIQGDANEGMYQIWVGSSSAHGFTPGMRLEKVKIPLSERARVPYATFPGSVP